jgi:hypothetical protein
MECHVQVTRKLEATLGPDTADMGIRFGKAQLRALVDDVVCLPHLTRISPVRKPVGMHSGPVTAGVLRGERCVE